jgi:hypothetical protein
MSRWIRFAALLAVLLGVVFALHSCSSIDRVSAPEFQRALERANAPESMHAFSPIGVTGQRAYIEHWSLVPILGEPTTVLWTPVSELPPELLAKLRTRG